MEYKWADYEELRVYRLTVGHTSSVELPRFKYLATVLVLAGSAETSDGTLMG